MHTLAVDPGSTLSAYVVIDDHYRPVRFGRPDNHLLLGLLPPLSRDSRVAIEQIGHYGTGMPAGASVFDTCIWIGRFIQALAPATPALVKRATVKAHICGSAKAKDSNVAQALVDRFAPGQRNHGKGTKDQPGWFYGFYRDIWQAYALAVYTLDEFW